MLLESTKKIQRAEKNTKNAKKIRESLVPFTSCCVVRKIGHFWSGLLAGVESD